MSARSSILHHESIPHVSVLNMSVCQHACRMGGREILDSNSVCRLAFNQGFHYSFLIAQLPLQTANLALTHDPTFTSHRRNILGVCHRPWDRMRWPPLESPSTKTRMLLGSWKTFKRIGHQEARKMSISRICTQQLAHACLTASLPQRKLAHK